MYIIKIILFIFNMSMFRIFLVVILSLALLSCGSVGKLLPSFAYNKDNQKLNSSDTMSQSIGQANVNLTAGDNKGKTYSKSNIVSKDLNSDPLINQGTNSTNFGGTHTDNSDKFITSTTNKDNRENKYEAKAQTIFNNIPISSQIFLVIQSWVGIFLGALFLFIGWKAHNFKVNYTIKRKYKKNNT